MLNNIFHISPTGCGEQKDNDTCLQKSPGWGDGYTCQSDKSSCTKWGRDMMRCCPDSCKTGQFNEELCNELPAKGKCDYTNAEHCPPKGDNSKSIISSSFTIGQIISFGLLLLYFQYFDKLVDAVTYESSDLGSPCTKIHLEVQKASECLEACIKLEYTIGDPFVYPDEGDYPGCLYTKGMKNQNCHFNEHPNPHANIKEAYSAICRKDTDQGKQIWSKALDDKFAQ